MSVYALGVTQRRIVYLADSAADELQQEPDDCNQCDKSYGEYYSSHLWTRHSSVMRDDCITKRRGVRAASPEKGA
jgi:hypothetical protein